MWQTPVSKISPSNSTPALSSSARAAATSGNPQRDVRGVRRGERLADVGRVDQVEADVLAELVLGPGSPPLTSGRPSVSP